MNMCEGCFYYGKARFGNICNYDGAFDPAKKECPNFKSKSQAEMETLKDIELSRLYLSIIDKLIKLQPEIKKVENKKLKGELLEMCLIAKQIKNLLGG
jgi:predicted phage-related endonuclease